MCEALTRRFCKAGYVYGLDFVAEPRGGAGMLRWSPFRLMSSSTTSVRSSCILPRPELAPSPFGSGRRGLEKASRCRARKSLLRLSAAMLVRVMLSSFVRVMASMCHVAMGGMSVVGSFFMISALVVLSGFSVVPSCKIMMLCRLRVVLRTFMLAGHRLLRELRDVSTAAG